MKDFKILRDYRRAVSTLGAADRRPLPHRWPQISWLAQKDPGSHLVLPAVSEATCN